jgi:hypothetical protein
MWIVLLLEAFEVGFLFGQRANRRRQRRRARELLVWGRRLATPLPLVDERLRKAVGTPTRTHTVVADGIVRAVRWTINTRAFELVVLQAACKRWPAGKRLDPKIRLACAERH